MGKKRKKLKIGKKIIKKNTPLINQPEDSIHLSGAYTTIISTDTAHTLIDTIITLDKNIIYYIMKY